MLLDTKAAPAARSKVRLAPATRHPARTLLGVEPCRERPRRTSAVGA
jgi:hypothetical protein